MRDRGPDALRGRGDRPGIGVEQLIFRRLRCVRACSGLAVIEKELRGDVHAR